MIIDDESYGYGYGAGYQDGQHKGYMDGWEDASHAYEARIAKLTTEIRLLEARVTVLAKKI